MNVSHVLNSRAERRRVTCPTPIGSSSDFDRDVIKTYRDLLRRHAELIGAVARAG
ncbi:Uncharacterised protein [Amycolatopsis camponoti]|uniref:Uncharacterized protein n=1 Tax=Amycolatopsis camponoti TaxID=2606593 RepID=A0A6I8LGN4_9PSEU|nr:hypothetical protein [Amycolatopsis camponoti]VVJ15187.1 Uncharacterised protein [Amycolatopsis camponoti]